MNNKGRKAQDGNQETIVMKPINKKSCVRVVIAFEYEEPSPKGMDAVAWEEACAKAEGK